MSECDKTEVYPSKLAKMSEFRHIFSRATLWVDIAYYIPRTFPEFAIFDYTRRYLTWKSGAIISFQTS